MPFHRNAPPRLKPARTALLSLLAALCLHEQADAQILFKCGNSYQDTPCAAGQENKVVRVGARSREPEQGIGDASCSQRGDEALKIFWRREGGATLEQALSRVQSASRRELIQDVYSVRGTAAQVRSRIENECMAEKERRERYAAIVGAGRPPLAASDNQPTASGEQTKPLPATAWAPQSDAKSEASRKKDECAFLATRLDGIRTSQRAGGDLHTMEQLRRELTRTEHQMQEAGCR